MRGPEFDHQICKNCIMWNRLESQGAGECRRYARYRPRDDDDWCGEFQGEGFYTRFERELAALQKDIDDAKKGIHP